MNCRDISSVYILSAPDSFSTLESVLPEGSAVHRELPEDSEIGYVLIFNYTEQDIEQWATVVEDKLAPDAQLWMAYPKKSSKNYKSGISRDHSWAPLGKLGMEGVRQVAIDDDWSAIRFRSVEYIKTMTRHKAMVLSQEGLDKTTGQ